MTAATARRSRERGALLVDYFLAATLFGIALTIFLSMSNIRVRATSEAEARLRAVVAVESKLAEIEAGKTRAEDAGFEVPGLARDTQSDAKTGFVKVRRRPDLGLDEVYVSVSWWDVDGRPHAVEAWTLRRP